MRPVSFGSYTSFDWIQDYRTNFVDGVPATTRLPGLDGGWNDDGYQALPVAIGVVSFTYYLLSDTRAGMDALRDAARAMQSYGLAKLICEPTDGGTDRYCWAYIHNMQLSERQDGHTDLWQPVHMVFHVPDPRWLVDAHTAWADAHTINASGTETTSTVNNAGSAPTLPRITITPGGGQTCENPQVDRIVSGVVVDRVKYTGTLSGASGNQLIIDGKHQLAQLDAADVWGSSFTYHHGDLFRLAPGNNSVKVYFENVGDAAEVRLQYADAWR